jgi:hypothetical protein
MNSSLPQPPSIQRKQTSKLAIASMVLGIFSPISLVSTHYFIFVYPVTLKDMFSQALIVLPIGVMAFVFGINALSRIEKYHNLKGKGLAIVGLVGGTFIVLLYLLILFILVALFFCGIP